MEEALSIIIPAYNEEKSLKVLIKSIKSQSYKDYKILVADANSKDKTVKVAKRLGAEVVRGGLPAKGRNSGAKFAKGEIFLFLDADTSLPKNFLKENFLEFKKRRLDIAGVDLIPDSQKRCDKLTHFAYNFWQRLVQKIDPHMSGACIFIKREVFFALGGFNEELMIAEDHALARKAHREKYKFGILSKGIFLSTRRLEKEGRIAFASKLFYFWFRRLFGEIKKSRIKYELKER